MPRYAVQKGERCGACGRNDRPMKRGWTNEAFCSEQCERSSVASLHNSMPGGPSPRPGWMPHHIAREISDRWEDS